MMGVYVRYWGLLVEYGATRGRARCELCDENRDEESEDEDEDEGYSET